MSLKQLLSVYSNKTLILQLAKREIEQKYRGSVFGVIWTIINPLLMLIIYTFVFSVIFESKWGQGTSDNHLEFALTLFCGLIVYNIFSETVTKAPNLIVSTPNLVKKVVFPLEILPIAAILSALFQSLISFTILLIFIDYSMSFPVFFFLVPLILMPLIFMTLGIAWFLASLGVYIRDISQTIGILVTMIFYMTPIFYPVSVVPAFFKKYMNLNPLTGIIESVRDVMIRGVLPDWKYLFYSLLFSLIVMLLGLMWFNKTRKGFADVV